MTFELSQESEEGKERGPKTDPSPWRGQMKAVGDLEGSLRRGRKARDHGTSCNQPPIIQRAAHSSDRRKEDCKQDYFREWGMGVGAQFRLQAIESQIREAGGGDQEHRLLRGLNKKRRKDDGVMTPEG